MSRIDLDLLEKVFSKLSVKDLAAIKKLVTKLAGRRKAVLVKTRPLRN